MKWDEIDFAERRARGLEVQASALRRRSCRAASSHLGDNAAMLNPVLIAGEGIALQPEFLVWRELHDGLIEIGMPE